MNEETSQEEVLEESKITEETTEEKTEIVSENTEEPKKQSKSQNAKQRLRRKNAELTEELTKQNERFAALEAKVDSVVNPKPERPQRDNFETEEEYEDSLYDWRTPEVKTVEPEPTQTEERKDVLSPEVRKSWDEQMDAGEDKYEDYLDTVYSIPHDSMTNSMTYAITESEQGNEVAYFLGKNPAEAERISKLSVTAQIREIDKLTNKFTSSTSSAPDPITPTKGTDTAVKDVSKMSMEEYADYRNRA